MINTENDTGNNITAWEMMDTEPDTSRSVKALMKTNAQKNDREDDV